jgi:phytanoyl-CoA hydroxylase
MATVEAGAVVEETVQIRGAALKDYPSMRAKFDEHGYVILKGLFAPQIIDSVRAQVSRLSDERLARFKAEGKISNLHENLPFETRLIEVAKQCKEASPAFFRDELHREALFSFLLNKDLLDIAEYFIGGEIRLYPNYMCRPKLPDDYRTQITWHQDAAYTASTKMGDVEQLSTVNLWAPLVPARFENGCMQFIPGSHKMGLVPYHTAQEIHLEIDNNVLEPLLKKAINIELDPGDVVMFHNMLFHQGLPNRSTTIRWSSDWRYQDATQPTLRKFNGHIARSRKSSASQVQNAKHWQELSFQ